MRASAGQQAARTVLRASVFLSLYTGILRRCVFGSTLARVFYSRLFLPRKTLVFWRVFLFARNINSEIFFNYLNFRGNELDYFYIVIFGMLFVQLKVRLKFYRML